MNYFTQKLSKKENGQKGFTLAELLIVVAIIAVLAIVAIPIFSAKLENSREETDIANIRSAKAAAVAEYLAGNYDTSKTYYFDAVGGAIVTEKPSVGYGKGTEVDGGCDDFALVVNPESADDQAYYDSETDVAGKVLSITFTDPGQITMTWVD